MFLLALFGVAILLAVPGLVVHYVLGYQNESSEPVWDDSHSKTFRGVL